MTPAAIVLLGDRLDALDMRRLGRRAFRRPEPGRGPVEKVVLVPVDEVRDAPGGADRCRRHRACCCCSARHSAISGGASPTIGSCPPRPRRARSLSSCAPISRSTQTQRDCRAPGRDRVESGELAAMPPRCRGSPACTSVSAPGGTFVDGGARSDRHRRPRKSETAVRFSP